MPKLGSHPIIAFNRLCFHDDLGALPTNIRPYGKLNTTERCLRKRASIRSQDTWILNGCQGAMQRYLQKSDAAVLHARLKNVTKNLETLDDKIEMLQPDEDFKDKSAQVLDYNDRILSCLTRL